MTQLATLMYTIGNGYNCGCCRHESRDTMDFELTESGVEWLISECIDYAQSNDWDFSTKRVTDYDGDAAALLDKIHDAVKQAEVDEKRNEQIQNLKSNIATINKWFDTLEQEKVTKAEKRDQYLAQLAELEK